jgi:hypothetical protein
MGELKNIQLKKIRSIFFHSTEFIQSSNGNIIKVNPTLTDKIFGKRQAEVHFKFADQEANEVYLIGDFSPWGNERIALKKSFGIWEIKLKLSPGKYQYTFEPVSAYNMKPKGFLLKKWEKQVNYFENNKNELLQKYKNKFVAIKDENVVGAADDKFLLAERISKKYPDDIVLIIEVKDEIPFVEISTPEFV